MAERITTRITRELQVRAWEWRQDRIPMVDDLIRSLDDRQKHLVLRWFMQTQIRQIRRESAQRIEREAMRERSKRVKQWQREEQQRLMREYNEAVFPSQRVRGEKKRAAHAKWLQTDEGRAELEKRQREREDLEETIFNRKMAMMRDVVEKIRDDLYVEWTEELLNTHFRLPNGQETTWGDATVAQHEARVEMFTKNATHQALGAARHQQAIEDIRRADAQCLNEVVVAA